MSRWLKLDIDRLNEPKQVKFRNHMVWTRPSPYDLPQAIRARLSEDRKHVLIELHYLDSEPGQTIGTEDPWLALSTGKYSGRVLGLVVDLSHFDLGEQSRLDLLRGFARALEVAKEKPSRPEEAMKTNYEIANTVISDNYDELVETLGK